MVANIGVNCVQRLGLNQAVFAYKTVASKVSGLTALRGKLSIRQLRMLGESGWVEIALLTFHDQRRTVFDPPLLPPPEKENKYN
jgi:hypothetical protein